MRPTSLATSLLHVTLLLLGILLLPLTNAASLSKVDRTSYAATCTRLQSALSFQSKVHHPRNHPLPPHLPPQLTTLTKS